MSQETTAEAAAEQSEQAAGNDTYAFKYPQSQKTVVLPAKIGNLETKKFLEDVIGQSNGQRRAEYKTQIEELTQKAATVETLQARIDELELQLLPAEQRKAKEYETKLSKQESAIKAERDTIQRLENDLRSKNLALAITSEVGKMSADLVSPEDAATLFRAQCSPALVQDGENFKTVAKIDGEEMELSEAWNKWISSPSKAHLLKNKLQPGGGSAGGGRAVAGVKEMRRADYDALSHEQRNTFLKEGGKVI